MRTLFKLGIGALALLGLVPVTAQTDLATPTKTAKTAPPAPSALSLSEQEVLRELYRKARPATLRIEQCADAACKQPEGVGTGFMIAPDGTALTAYHVVFQAEYLQAVTSDGVSHKVQVVGYDDQHDLAVLRVQFKSSPRFLKLAPTAPKIGDAVLSIGNGGGTFLTPKMGKLLALKSDSGRADFPDGTLELSAPLIPGDSGGPVLNRDGEVVGVVSFISVRPPAPGSQTPNITSYAVPLTASDALLARLRGGSKQDAPIIGVSLNGQWTQLASLPENLFKQANTELKLQLGDTAGAFFTAVAEGSPAAKAGLQPLKFDGQGKRLAGDLVTAVNGKRVTNFSEFQFAVRRYAPGQTILLTVQRGSRTLTLKLTLVGRSSIRGE